MPTALIIICICV